MHKIIYIVNMAVNVLFNVFMNALSLSCNF